MMMNLYSTYLVTRSVMARHDMAYRALVRAVGAIRPRQRALVANERSEIVIDGFQRSANTYFVSFFEIAQRRDIAIARHLHEAYQIRFAERHSIPCVVLVREPLDCVVSAMMRDHRAHPRALLGNYVRFYTEVLRVRKRSIIAPFEVVVGDANRIISAVNQAYGTDFKLLEPGMEHAVRSEVEQKDRNALGGAGFDATRAASPSKAKGALAASLRADVEQRCGSMLQRARLVYAEMLNAAV